MIKELLLPKLGQTMEVATVERWVKNVGDEVNKGEVVCEITTDKATLEVESYQRGVLLKTFAEEGMLLPVNTPIAIVGKPDDEIPSDVIERIEAAIQKGLVRAEKIASGEIIPGEDEDQEAAPAPKTEKAAPPAPEPSAPKAPAVEAVVEPVAPAPAPKPAGSSVVGWRAQVLKERPSHILVSPRAKKLAADKKIRLEQIKPTGPGGRIVEKDVAELADRLTPDRISPLALAEAYDKRVDLMTLLEKVSGKIAEADLKSAPVFSEAPTAEDKAVRLTPMRRIVAERLGQSKREIPHYYLRATCNMTKLVALRGEVNRSTGAKHSYNDFIMKALGKALRAHPAMATRWDGKQIVQRGQIGIGLAVALDDGLIVPVVKDVDRKSVSEIAEASRALVSKARSKQLLPEEYEGAVMTISNLGAFGIDWVLPIINPGESAILGVGAIEDKVVAIDGNIGVRAMCYLTVAVDHRLADGAVGAAFLRQVVDLLESPAQLMEG